MITYDHLVAIISITEVSCKHHYIGEREKIYANFGFFFQIYKKKENVFANFNTIIRIS